MIAIYCGAAVDGRPATVYGDGRQTRDFVYVGDVVGAFIAGAESAAVGHCNVATGRETSVLDLTDALGLEPHFELERPGEVRRSCLDASAARELIGWKATTSLGDGLVRTLDAAHKSRSRAYGSCPGRASCDRHEAHRLRLVAECGRRETRTRR